MSATLILLSVIIVLLILQIILQITNRPGLEKVQREVLQQMKEHETSIRQEFVTNRQDVQQLLQALQENIGSRLSDFGEHNSRLMNVFNERLQVLNKDLKDDFKSFDENTSRSLKEMRLEVHQRLEKIQKDNNEKLEKMRLTVDEKLHKTLEERLGRSFKMVNDSLEKVQKGLGEMQNLATGVGDLKRVLSNVKTRGVLGEIQLGNILDQLLTPEQYALNVATIPNSQNHVEFAVKFPGQSLDDQPIWLPIDSKFPLDRYEQLLLAYEEGDHQSIDRAHKDLIRMVKVMAKDIQSKYIAPPHTTDFGVLFLPIEGLYAEVVRHPGLMESLQRDYRILVAGPTNLAAFLNSLQMGFRSLAIEKRSSEVWKILGAVKTEFGKFGDVLAKTQKKLQEASNVIDKAGVRTRAIERKLRNVEELPSGSVDGKIEE